ncbi:MAG: gas vesicle protein [Betaproteobacteria bacterium]|nr:gas vesicle protein [Betaproteobacteria bacterium]
MAVPKRTQGSMTHAVESATLADVLERILDKGLVVAGDIKIKLVDIELLTIQIRLLVCSVEKAREMGIDWWTTNSYLSSNAAPQKSQVEDLSARIARLEEAFQQPQPLAAQAKGKAHL